MTHDDLPDNVWQLIYKLHQEALENQEAEPEPRQEVRLDDLLDGIFDEDEEEPEPKETEEDEEPETEVVEEDEETTATHYSVKCPVEGCERYFTGNQTSTFRALASHLYHGHELKLTEHMGRQCPICESGPTTKSLSDHMTDMHGKGFLQYHFENGTLKEKIQEMLQSREESEEEETEETEVVEEKLDPTDLTPKETREKLMEYLAEKNKWVHAKKAGEELFDGPYENNSPDYNRINNSLLKLKEDNKVKYMKRGRSYLYTVPSDGIDVKLEDDTDESVDEAIDEIGEKTWKQLMKTFFLGDDPLISGDGRHEISYSDFLSAWNPTKDYGTLKMWEELLENSSIRRALKEASGADEMQFSVNRGAEIRSSQYKSSWTLKVDVEGLE